MKVVFLDTVHQVLEDELIKAEFTCVDGTKFSLEECKSKLSDADGIVIRARFTLNEELLKFAPILKFIARSGAGMENIDTNYCEKKGIKLFNAPEGNRNAVGEHALGMLLSLFNKIHTANYDVKNGLWEREKNRGIELDGKTIGLIGFGNNGGAFAEKLRGFEVEILAYDKYKTGFSNSQVKESTLNEIFEKSDVISFHIPQNEETLFMGNADFFFKFKKSIYVLNLSRGKIIESKALLKAIKTKKVLGAGLDVLEFEKASFENLFDNSLPSEFLELIQRKEVLLTPHVGGWTNESYFKLSTVLAEKIISWKNKN